jgi:predicted RNA binding protein YcfA (HicA-like mRNA interferase family)
VKRVDLIKTIEEAGCVLARHGAKHDWYRNVTTGALQAVPRHRELKEHLARRIIKILCEEAK